MISCFVERNSNEKKAIFDKNITPKYISEGVWSLAQSDLFSGTSKFKKKTFYYLIFKLITILVAMFSWLKRYNLIIQTISLIVEDSFTALDTNCVGHLFTANT